VDHRLAAQLLGLDDVRASLGLGRQLGLLVHRAVQHVFGHAALNGSVQREVDEGMRHRRVAGPGLGHHGVHEVGKEAFL